MNVKQGKAEKELADSANPSRTKLQLENLPDLKQQENSHKEIRWRKVWLSVPFLNNTGLRKEEG